MIVSCANCKLHFKSDLFSKVGSGVNLLVRHKGQRQSLPQNSSKLVKTCQHFSKLVQVVNGF